ncbi:MAG: glycosyltransferase, partial [bacterium]
MTKIAMVSMSYYPNDPRIRKQAECLTREGFSVDIICLRGPAEPKVEQLGRVRVYRKVKGRDKESVLTYLRLSALFMISAFLMLQKLTLRNRYQLLHIHNMPDYLVFVGIVQKILRIPIILDLHDLSVELFETKWPGRASPPVISIVRFAEKMSCRFADSVITTSLGFRHKLINRGIRPDKISLILNSADGRIFKKKSSRQFRKIRQGAQLLYHGSIAERFGLL